MLKALQEKRQALAAKIKELGSKAGDFNSEDQAAWDSVNADYDANSAAMDIAERADAIEKENETVIDKRAAELRGASHDQIREIKAATEHADDLMLNAFARNVCGKSLTDEQRSALENAKSVKGELELNLPKKRSGLQHVGATFRAQATTPASAGGDLIPQGFMAELEKRMLTFGPMANLARAWRTNSGNAIPWPTTDDTANSGVLLGENSAVSEQDVTFANVTFNAFKYSSDLIKVSQELMEDSEFNVGDVLLDILAERLGRITNTHLTTGTGTAQPRGAVTASGLGVTAAAIAAITADELIDLQASVDVAYQPNATFQARQATITTFRKFKTSDLQYIWQSGLSAGQPDTLLGNPILANNDIAALATGVKTVLYGDMSKYIHRTVLGMRFLVLNELFRASDQVGFIAFIRQDGDSIQDNAMKHLIQA